jgi:hypothetical protein
MTVVRFREERAIRFRGGRAMLKFREELVVGFCVGLMQRFREELLVKFRGKDAVRFREILVAKFRVLVLC